MCGWYLWRNRKNIGSAGCSLGAAISIIRTFADAGTYHPSFAIVTIENYAGVFVPVMLAAVAMSRLDLRKHEDD